MSISLKRLAETSALEIADLERVMTEFYTRPCATYYEMADRVAFPYRARYEPFHYDLVQRIEDGTSLLELGCGTAHLCPAVEAKGGTYTGMDHAPDLLARNRAKFPKARFFSLDDSLEETFDVVASLYTIEHVPDPPRYLARMLRFARPGGLAVIICPEFIDNDSLPPSLFYGTTPRRLREKLFTLSLADAFWHLLDLKWHGGRWQRKARRSPAGSFWLNLQPRVLHGAEYSVDADAIHLSRLIDIVNYFKKQDAEIIATSHSMTGVDPLVLRYNCYVVARTPSVPRMPR